MSRLKRFVEDCQNLLLEIAGNDDICGEFDSEENSLELTFKNGEEVRQTILITANDDYPEGTYLVLDSENMLHSNETVPEIFAKYLGKYEKINAGTAPSPAQETDDDFDYDIEEFHTAYVLDTCLEADISEVKNWIKSDSGFDLVSVEVFLPIETATFSYLMPIDQLKPQVVKAWGLTEDEPLVIRLDHIHTTHYRESQKYPEVSVFKQDDIMESNKFAVGEQLKMILRTFVRDNWNPKEGEEKGNILLEFCNYARKRLADLSEFCMICDEKHFVSMLLPAVCFRPLCTFAFENLGLMADVAILGAETSVLDLLLAFLYASALCDRRQLVFNPFPSVADPQNPGTLVLDPKKPDYAKVQEIVCKLPCISEFLLDGVKESLSNVHKLAVPLIRWTMTSNRCYLTRLPQENRIEFMGTNHQFLMLADSPQKEELFCRAKEESKKDSIFLFHGSPLENWHSILRKGLINASGTQFQMHGTAHGSGVYFSPLGAVSKDYSYGRRIPTRAMQSRQCPVHNSGDKSQCTENGKYLGMGGNLCCIAICEVVDSDALVRAAGDQIWVLKNPDHCCTRFLFVFDNKKNAMQIQTVDLRQADKKAALEKALGFRHSHIGGN